jgi:1,4-alpha-glucan branching enzyme
VARRAEGDLLPFSIVDDGSGMRTIRVAITDAHRVELMGDFTGWDPIDLALDENGAWAASLRIPPGVHRVNVRVDGGPWIAPPGLATITDDFGGRVGVFVVR